MAGDYIGGAVTIFGIVLTFFLTWLTQRGSKRRTDQLVADAENIRQAEAERKRMIDLLDAQGDELVRMRSDRERDRTEREHETERRRMAEAERDAAYELLRGAHIGVPRQG